MDHQTFYDMVRGLSFTMFVVVMFQIGYVIWHYLKVYTIEKRMGMSKSGLIPIYVIGVSISYLGALGTNAIHSVGRIGESPDVYWFINPFTFVVAILSLNLIMTFEQRRYRYVMTQAGVEDLLEDL